LVEESLIDLFGSNFTDQFARRAMAMNSLSAATALQRLATGCALNSAADAPADVIVATSLDSSLAELDGQSEVNTRASNQAAVADGFLGSISGLLTGAKSLAVANADSTLSDAERQANQTQLDSILDSVDRLSQNASFDGQKLLDGSGSIASSDGSLALPDTSSASIGNVTVNGVNYALTDTGSGQPLNIVDGNIAGASQVIDQATNDISTLRGQIGAFDQGTAASQGALVSSQIQLSSSLSMIQDTDVALEMSREIRAQTLAAAGNYALGFAGAYPGGLLSMFA
jgi:flagellin